MTSACRVEIASSVVRNLKKLPPDLQTALFRKIALLREQPYPPGAEKVIGVKQGYRIREGDYRIAYLVIDERTILVVKIGHRSEVYRRIVAALDRAASKWKRTHAKP